MVDFLVEMEKKSRANFPQTFPFPFFVLFFPRQDHPRRPKKTSKTSLSRALPPRPPLAAERRKTESDKMGLPHPFATLLPTRFLLQVFHLIAVLTVVYDADGISKELVASQGGDLTGTKASLEAVSWAAIVCLAFDFVGLFLGFSVFSVKVNCFHIMCHFLGALLVALFVADYWNTESYTYLFVFFNLLPTSVELYKAITVLRVKVMFSA